MSDPAWLEPGVRAVAFAVVFLGLAAWELAAPRRAHQVPRRPRWVGNFGVLAVDTLLLRLLFPLAAVGVALHADARGYGILNLIAVPAWLHVLVSIVVLDLALYSQHALFHRVPLLWRLHRMHHADLELDATTGVRFHPLEILLSMLIKAAVVAALGAHAVGVLVFEVLLNATSMFNHANVRLSPRVDAVLRWLVVTPDMHRVHHSLDRRETDSNYGFNLPWWDRLFRTYRAQPAAGHEGMTLGIPQFRSRGELALTRLLTQPFRSG